MTQSFGQITSITDPMGHVYKYTYDASGNMAYGDGSRWQHDFLCRTTHLAQVIQATDPLGGKTTQFVR